MKLSFIHAPNIQYDQNYGTLFSPVWAYTLAAYVPDNWDMTVCDCCTSDPDMISAADIFAFSGINQDIESIKSVFDLLKRKYPNAIFVLGGPITWSMEQEGKLSILDFFDYLFVLDGEQTFPDFLNKILQGERASIDRIIRADRYPMDKSKSVNFDLYRSQAPKYYGAVVEVSRGCPFLCEFCDIRVLPGNNRANNKDPEIIVAEMDEYFRLGITQFQFACDNFIGDVAWARRCVDAILEWKVRVNAKISIFTWLTINLYKLPELMDKMRRAGFSIVFIGLESVNQNSLLETAKVQNTKDLETAVMTIQSYGFIIAPGFIFGFDSDTVTVFDETLDFMRETGTIGGDPSFLMALPGTPLYTRMKRTGRLLSDDDGATVRRKITTNIRYLQDSGALADGFIGFVQKYTDADFQLVRFKNHVDRIVESKRFVPIDGVGYGSPLEYLKLQLGSAESRKMMFLRLVFLLKRPANILAVLKALRIVRQAARHGYDLDVNFNYWVYVWTNIGIKYWSLKKTDFDLHTVPSDFDISRLLFEGDDESVSETKDRKLGNEKTVQQSRLTNSALKQLVESRAKI